MSDQSNSLYNNAFIVRRRALVRYGHALFANLNVMMQLLKAIVLLAQEMQDNESSQTRWRTRSQFGRRANIERGRLAGHEQLLKDYFDDNCTYPAETFRRRFRVSRNLFLRLMRELSAHDDFFVLGADATGLLGHSPYQKIAAALRLLAYGCTGASVDEYVRMGTTSSLKCLRYFCRAVVELYESTYLRVPTEQDQKRLMEKHALRGFPGMLGSLGCMHWAWKNCPAAWKGQYQGKEGQATVVLEAVADHETWIWHSYFGVPGTQNDITILRSSPLHDQGRMASVPFHVEENGRQFPRGYYLVDGIYPPWPTLISTVPPTDPKHKLFSERQKAARKDVERAFERLQSKWHMISKPFRMWSVEEMGIVMKCCIILHNMTIEDERDDPAAEDQTPEYIPGTQRESSNLTRLTEHLRATQDRGLHNELKNALIDHIWDSQSVL